MLLAYAKLSLHDELLDSPVPDDPYLGKELERYFPAEMRERFPDAIATHRLRREIIATQLANAIINRGGPTMVARLVDQTGADAPTIAAAYAATRDSFGLTEMNVAIDALDGVVPGRLQLRLYGELQDLLMNRIVWFIRHVDFATHSLDAIIGTYEAGIAEVERHLRDALAPRPGRMGGADAGLVEQGAPEDLARRLAALPDLVAAPDIVLTAQRTGKSVADIARTHFALEAAFRLGALIGARARDPRQRLLRPSGPRPGDRRASRWPTVTSPPRSRPKALRGRGRAGLEREARRRRGPHPQRGRQHRGLGPHPVEGDRCGEPAGRSRKGLKGLGPFVRRSAAASGRRGRGPSGAARRERIVRITGSTAWRPVRWI